ncbi:pyridoxamine 5'-phosphate oxidase family protein [Arthrobacter sp. SDTb3-6]|uniref:pyridoxamine 5'-phosphate oxidase family protein n=1 Tax=Arthrobacter sp. SDTb3-6 TaxID=2713571 RepID=UPI00159E1BF9|nr:pyridoxamine 5'-phosphate oxidase family protein [Arthrobacter sp. SDTb3-6]NVM99800.1 pyridoxamine 5'-phosphate oxidase family protein [Arthrobacter sp. SDTb3-6]
MRDNAVAPKASILTTEQCWKLLSETSVGRLAVTVEGRPDVFPVNYRIDEQTLLFRTGGGTKLDAISADALVAVEADAVSAEFGLAWSVVVKGRAEVSKDSGTALNSTAQGLFPWQGVGKDRLVRIVPETVTGRRFTLDASMTWHVPLDEAIRAGLE